MGKTFLKIYQKFPYFTPYWGQTLYLNKSECLLPSLVEIGQVDLEKKFGLIRESVTLF